MVGLVGFAVGYVLGCRRGREGLEELLGASQSIWRSEEFRSLVDTGIATLGSVVKQGTGVFTDGSTGGPQHQLGPRAA